MSDLKPCPFCGGEATGYEWSDDDEIDEGEPHAQDAYCAVAVDHKDDCLLKVGEFYMWIAATEEEASKIWNTRVEHTCKMTRLMSVGRTDFVCDQCDHCTCYTKPNFCPTCGAKVVGE